MSTIFAVYRMSKFSAIIALNIPARQKSSASPDSKSAHEEVIFPGLFLELCSDAQRSVVISNSIGGSQLKVVGVLGEVKGRDRYRTKIDCTVAG